jgi:GDSL-like Lipase/Acylhydrolase family/Ricin-type beta-trefoil lectin domain
MLLRKSGGASAADCIACEREEIIMAQGPRRLFIVATVGIAALALGAGTIRPAPARAATGTYVALGDSYSAGAGVPPYLHDSPNPSDTDGCDRSASAWPETLGSDLGFSGTQFSFHACTGSVVQDLTRTNPATGELPQENWLTPDTRLVTLTWGGNNVGFMPVLTACVLSWSCPITVGSALDSAIASIEPTLVSAYEEIANRAPSATIIVMGYPRFFPTTPPAVCYTGVGTFTFIGAQMSWMNGEIQKLDTQIQAAVTAAQQTGKNVWYATGSYDAFTGHELCTADPYMNDAVPTNPFSLSNPVQTKSFHPNLAGNEQLAKVAWLADVGARPNGTLSTTLTDVATGFCLDSNDNGAVYTLRCNGGNYQRWLLQPVAGSASEYNVVDAQTALCLDSNTSGRIYTLPCNGGNYQNWGMTPANSTPNQFQDMASQLCLDSNASGQAYTLSCNGGNYQRWQRSS